MSKHVWLQTRFSGQTVDRAVYAIELAVKSGLVETNDILRWVGYLVEQVQQKGYGKVEVRTTLKKQPGETGHRSYRDGRVYYDVTVKYDLASVADRAIRGGFKYATGRNRDNYVTTGVSLVAAAAPRFGFDASLVKSTPAALIEYLTEMMSEAPDEFDRLKNLNGGMWELLSPVERLERRRAYCVKHGFDTDAIDAELVREKAFTLPPVVYEELSRMAEAAHDEWSNTEK